MTESQTRILAIVVFAAVVFGLGVSFGRFSTSSQGSKISDEGTREESSPLTMFTEIEIAMEQDGISGSELPPKGPTSSLVDILENLDRQARERELEELGEAHFDTGADWGSFADSIGDLVDREIYLRGVLSKWAAKNPVEALRYLDAQSLSTRCNLMPHAVSIWAKTNSIAAEEWVLSLKNGEVKNRSIESLYTSWATIDPESAAAKSLDIIDASVRHRALAGVVREWSSNDLASAKRWATGLTDPSLRDVATITVADEMAGRSPSEAMRWTSEYLAGDPAANPEIVTIVASKAGFANPLETLKWLATVNSSPETSSSIAGVAAYLAEADPNFAWNGFGGLSSELKTITAPSFASILGSQDPVSGQKWLDQLPPGEMKQSAAAALSAGWALRDPAAAKAWAIDLQPGPIKDAAMQGFSSTVGDGR